MKQSGLSHWGECEKHSTLERVLRGKTVRIVIISWVCDILCQLYLIMDFSLICPVEVSLILRVLLYYIGCRYSLLSYYLEIGLAIKLHFHFLKVDLATQLLINFRKV